MMKKKNRRFRMSDYTAKKLGLTINISGRYRLNEKQFKQFSELKRESDIKRLFFDIETSPMMVYSWRIGYNIKLDYENVINDWKIICISYKWQHDEKVKHLTWDKNQCDKEMLENFIKIMNQADECVAHNGDRFDIKKIRTRCIYHRIPMMPKYRTLDTLKKSRSGFSFPNNKLDTILKYLGIGEKLKHDGFPMWINCMKGDKKALKDMVKYCDIDVLRLEDAFLTLQNYIKPNTHVGVIHGNPKYSCSCCGNDEDLALLKNDVTEKGTISRVMECQTCGHTYNISNSAYRYFLEDKSNYSSSSD